jgi:hypothetical protein
MDAHAVIAGWKRYPVHQQDVKKNPAPKNKDGSTNSNIVSRFKPLKAGAEFKCTIRYHNLRPVELGALLSALTFHGAEDAYHSIGMAKPLGYGKIAVTIESFSAAFDKAHYLRAYEAYMNARLGHRNPKWHQSEPVKELLAMARNHTEDVLRYMTLKEHRDAKNGKEALRTYSRLVGSTQIAVSLCDEADIEEMRNFHQAGTAQLDKPTESELVSAETQRLRNALRERYARMQAGWLQALGDKLQAVKDAEQRAIAEREAQDRDQVRKERAQEAREQGPGLDVKVDRNAEKKLINVLERWGRDAYKTNNIQTILPNHPNGYLPAEYHEQLFAKLLEIVDGLSASDRKKWTTPPPEQNAKCLKLAEWVGKEKAVRFFRESIIK